MGHRHTSWVIVAAAAALVAVATPAVAFAKSASPRVATRGWYWEDQQETGDPSGTLALLFPNPFCPPGAANQECGRLPVEVRGGDYETPNKVSTVGFDLTRVPIGSTVKKFTVTFKEADDAQGEPSPNVDDKKLQACTVKEFFASGDARPYKERPKFDCSKRDPRAKRTSKQQGKGEDAETIHLWKFNLTSYAKKWVKKGALVTGVLLAPVEPKDPGPQDSDWRVVLAGPDQKRGIKTQLVFVPSADQGLEGFGGLGGGGGGASGGFGSGGAGSGSFGAGGSTFSSGSPSFSSGGTTGSVGGGGGGGADTTVPPQQSPAPAPSPTGTAPVAAEETEPAEGLPYYVWLALLAGIVGFSLVRSAVIERATGVRPDGPLARIRSLNQARRGASLTFAEPTGPLAALAPVGAALMGGGRMIKNGIGSVASAVGGRFRRGG